MIDGRDIEEMQVKQKAAIRQDMSKKLRAFDRVASKVAAKVARSATHNPMLAEALQMKPIAETQNHMGGMQVGKFGLFMVPNESGKTRYDVANENTGQKIVGGLHLVEGANAIIRLLNKGYSFYSPQIKEILEIEAKYVKNYNDALTFKKKIKNNPTRDAILETRFEEAKSKANEAKEKLLEYIKKI